jgi:uncharacterized paraquat-inducible protein A
VSDPAGRVDLGTLACPDCDLLQRVPPLPPGGKARCERCGSTIATQSTDPINRPLALTFAAAFVFIVANTAPLMGLSAAGRQASTTIVNGAWEMWLQGQEITALIIAFCAVIAPGGYILFMLTVLLAVRWPPAPKWVGEMLRWASSTTYNRRTATRDGEIAGQPITAGDKVTLWWASANRDEAVFANPSTRTVSRLLPS